MIAGGGHEGEMGRIRAPLDVGPAAATAGDVVAERGTMLIGRHFQADDPRGVHVDDHPLQHGDVLVAGEGVFPGLEGRVADLGLDQIHVTDMYLVKTKVRHPTLEAWKYPLPGDEHVAMCSGDHRRGRRAGRPLENAARSTSFHALRPHRLPWRQLSRVQWSPDSTHLAFVSTSRDYRQENLKVADGASGETRDVLEETVSTFFESGNGRVNWRYLPDSNESIWFSERDNWGHLYLYDLQTGKLKHQITRGEGNVTQLLRSTRRHAICFFLRLDARTGATLLLALLSGGLDGSNPELQTPEDATHDVRSTVGQVLRR